jgi:rhodanese-related sulfurtransferase
MPHEEQHQKPKKHSRRWIIGGSAAAIVGGGAVFASKWFNVFADLTDEGLLSAKEAQQQAEAGEIYLVDIRRPDEWERTGIAVSALAIDMRRDDFESVLQNVFAQRGARPVALICARGVRSNRMNSRLKDAGFTHILDVPEGMLGSGAGAGYIEQGLPLRAPTAAERAGQVLQG